jgi:hypothetical protein
MPGVKFEPCAGTGIKPTEGGLCAVCSKDSIVIMQNGGLRRHKAMTDEERAATARRGDTRKRIPPQARAVEEEPATEVRCRHCGELLDIAFQEKPRVLFVDSCGNALCASFVGAERLASRPELTGVPF